MFWGKDGFVRGAYADKSGNPVRLLYGMPAVTVNEPWIVVLAPNDIPESENEEAFNAESGLIYIVVDGAKALMVSTSGYITWNGPLPKSLLAVHTLAADYNPKPDNMKKYTKSEGTLFNNDQFDFLFVVINGW